MWWRANFIRWLALLLGAYGVVVMVPCGGVLMVYEGWDDDEFPTELDWYTALNTLGDHVR